MFSLNKALSKELPRGLNFGNVGLIGECGKTFGPPPACWIPDWPEVLEALSVAPAWCPLAKGHLSRAPPLPWCSDGALGLQLGRAATGTGGHWAFLQPC